MMGFLPDNGFCYFKEPALSERGDGIQFTAGFFQPLPFQQPALGPWSWQVSREQMLRKIGSFTKCLQILPAGPLPILPPSPLRENMHVCPQPLSSGSLLMGLVLKAWGGALQGLVSSSLPHPQGEMSLTQPGWGSGGSHQHYRVQGTSLVEGILK